MFYLFSIKLIYFIYFFFVIEFYVTYNVKDELQVDFYLEKNELIYLDILIVGNFKIGRVTVENSEWLIVSYCEVEFLEHPFVFIGKVITRLKEKKVYW